MADDRSLSYRPRTGAGLVAKLSAGVLAWLLAGYVMTTIALSGPDRFGRTFVVWAGAIALSGGFVRVLESKYPRLRPHAWTLLAVAVPVGLVGRLGVFDPVAAGLVTVGACWAACAAGTWLAMDSTTDLIVWRAQDLAHSPAVTFTTSGVDFQPAFGRSSIVHLAWPEVLAVALVPGPIGRPALCVVPQNDLPPAEVARDGGIDADAVKYMHRYRLFDTPIALYLHNTKGPALPTLDRMLGRWTSGRLSLDTGRHPI